MSRSAHLLNSIEYLAANAPTIDPDAPDPGMANAKRLADAATAKLRASRPTAKLPLNFPARALEPQRPDPWDSVQRKLTTLDEMAQTLADLRAEIARLTPKAKVRR